MTKIISAIIIIVLIVTLGVLEQVFIHQSFNDLVLKAGAIQSDIEVENYDLAVKHTDELILWWRGKRNIIELVSPHNEVKDHIAYIAQLQGQLESKQYDDALATTFIIKEDAVNKLNILGYRIKNVF